jgi:hypothetical protein
MSNIDERVKKIVIEQLGVKEDEVTDSSSFVDDLGADWLWRWKRNSNVKFLMKKQKRSPLSSRLLITSTPTRSDSFLENSSRTLA